MNKSTFFTGQPIFTQLVKFIPRSIISKASAQYSSDRYCKKFDTYHHLITMLYCCYQQCTSLREVVSGMAACEGRLQSTGIDYLPARSTLSEANARRTYKVFEQIYLELYKRYGSSLADSRIDKTSKKLIIIDSTTISLFKDILKSAGNSRSDGRRKGGIKVHSAVRFSEDVPYLVRFTAGAANDVTFLKHLRVPRGGIVVMDRGYNNYNKLHEWNKKGVNWVTRLRNYSVITFESERKVTDQERQLGVINDQTIVMGFANKKIQQVKCRLITYYDWQNERTFQFLTNNRKWKPSRIAEIYRKRWQIELLFKRLKQNMPLDYFLGDNENAIKVQIYCALIADLLLKLIARGLKRRWAFSNLAAIVRLHLMNYTDLRKFLENPERCAVYNPPPQNQQLKLFSSA